MKRLTLRVPFELWQILKNLANKRGQTLNGFLIELLWDYVDK